MSNFFRRVFAEMITWLRSRGDRAWFLIRGDTLLFVSVTLVSFELIQRLKVGPPWLPPALAVLALLITLVLLCRDLRTYFGNKSGWQFSRQNPAFDPALVIRAGELHTRMQTPVGNMFVSPSLNAALGDARAPVELKSLSYRLDGPLRTHATTFMKETGPTSPFNGRCLALGSELSVAAVTSENPLSVREARYFDALCSNQLTPFRIARHGVSWGFHDRYLFQPRMDGDSVRELIPIDASEMANVIGVSTLGVTTDDHLVLVLQSRRSGSSAGRWAPSGSGSLEPHDFVEHSTLPELMSRGAVRELLEECALTPTQIADSQVIGYGRWLEHGGKPEFVTLTALTVSSEDIKRTPRWRPTEAAWTQVVRPVTLRLDQFAACGDPWEYDGLLAPTLTADDELHGGTSLPLEFALRCLVDAIRRDPGLIVRLRGSAPITVSPN